jgi:hypothetical protein
LIALERINLAKKWECAKKQLRFGRLGTFPAAGHCQISTLFPGTFLLLSSFPCGSNQAIEHKKQREQKHQAERRLGYAEVLEIDVAKKPVLLCRRHKSLAENRTYVKYPSCMGREHGSCRKLHFCQNSSYCFVPKGTNKPVVKPVFYQYSVPKRTASAHAMFPMPVDLTIIPART